MSWKVVTKWFFFGFCLLNLSACQDCEDDGPKVVVQNNANNTTNNTKKDMSSNSSNKDSGMEDTSNNNQTNNDMGGNSDSSNDTSNNTNTDQGANNNTGNDQGGMETDLGTCRGDDCTFTWTEADDCKQVLDLGTFDVNNDAKRTLYGNTNKLDSIISSTCADTGATSVEFVFGFQVSETAFIDINLKNIDPLDWVIAIREGTCTENSEFVCQDSGQEFFLAKQNKTYFIVVEPRTSGDRGEFELELSFTPTVCEPVGARTCASETLSICEGGLKETTYECGVACNTDACAGDTCDDAIALTAMGSNTFEGSGAAYTNKFDAKDHMSCSLEGALETPGNDRFFRLTGLTAGQKIIVEANAPEDQNDDAIFITQACGAQITCLSVKELGDNLSYTVPSDGDYIVIIDSLLELSKNYKHTVKVE